MKRDITFEEFSKKLDGFNEICGSCKCLIKKEDKSICEKHNVERSRNDLKCGDWRYFA